MSELANYKGVGYLRRKLAAKSARVNLRYEFYEMKNLVRDLGISTPPQLKWLTEILGWCGKGVDSLADRLVFREFRNDNLDLNEIYQMNNQDIITDSSVLSAMISSCCFVYIYADDNGYPKLEVIDGGNATGELDPVTMLLREGYAVLKRDPDKHRPIIEAYFLPKQTIYRFEDGSTRTWKHPVNFPLLVPVINKPDAKRPFGHSRISRACMSLQASAIRTIKRSEISAEFFSFPQKYATGLDPEAEKMDKWNAAISMMLTYEKSADGSSPTLGQFTQQSMQPHVDQLKMFASLFAGEVGLTLEDLGFPTANPTSAEAIKASHDNLRLAGRKAQRNIGTGLLNAGYLAACLRDETNYSRNILYMTKPAWQPMFEPDAAAMSGIGDAVLKINQALPGYLDEEKMTDLIGV